MSPERISNLEGSAYRPFSFTFSHINKTGNHVYRSGSSKEFQFGSSIPVLKMGVGSNSVSL
jgi:hypothetical protein